MNNQEAIEAIRSNYPTSGYEMLKEALNMAMNALEQQEKERWHVVADGDLPKCEKEVEITVERHYEDKIYTFTCRAIYEDGNRWNEDSSYNWNDFDNAEYDEEKDDWKVPEGWSEAVSYAEEFAVIDDFVIAWKELPEEYKSEEGE